MKKSVTILVTVLLTVIIWAQAPQKFSYQAIIRNNSNALIINTQLSMKISILQGSSSGTAVYSETHTPISDTNGLISLEIGSGTPVSGNFYGINWANGTYFIKTETDPTGGTSYTILSISQLLSVPYALHAGSTDQRIFDRILVDYDSQMSDPQIMLYEKGNDYARISFRSNDFLRYWTIAGHINENTNNDRLNIYHATAGDVLSISTTKTSVNKNLEVLGESNLQNLIVNGTSGLQNTQVNGNINFQSSLSVNGNQGINGQVLTTKGAGQNPVWGSGVNSLFNGIYSVTKDYPTSLVGGSRQTDQIIHSVNVTVDKNCILKLTGNYEATGDNISCFLEYDVSVYTGTYPLLINSQPDRITGQSYHFAKPSAVFKLTPGSFTFRVNVTVFSTSSNIYFFNSQNTNTLVEILPEF